MAFHGRQTNLRTIPGLRIIRVEHPSGQRIDAHGHDLACLTLYRCGGYIEQVMQGEAPIDGPAVAYHPPHAPHANLIGGLGLETLSILFDPLLLRGQVSFDLRGASQIWVGGVAARAAQVLLRELRYPAHDPALPIARFLSVAHAAQPTSQPGWLETIKRALAAGPVRTVDLARRLDLHPAWLARAYLHAVGESLQATARRQRVEQAMLLIHGGATSLADVAAATGFCDQSHMARCFNAVIGRPPSAVAAANALAA